MFKTEISLRLYSAGNLTGILSGQNAGSDNPGRQRKKEKECKTMNKTNEMYDVATVILVLLLIEIVLEIYLNWGDLIQFATSIIRAF